MSADHIDMASTEITVPGAINRCGCGRLAMARCWLGENFPAAWLVSCDRQSGLLPDTPEAA